ALPIYRPPLRQPIEHQVDDTDRQRAEHRLERGRVEVDADTGQPSDDPGYSRRHRRPHSSDYMVTHRFSPFWLVAWIGSAGRTGCHPKSIRSVPSPRRGCRTASPHAPARSGPGSCPVRSSSPGPRTVGCGCGTRGSHEHRFADVARVDHNHHLPPVVLDQVRLNSDVAAFGAFRHGDHGRLHTSKWMNSHTDAQAATTQRPHQGSRRTWDVQVGTRPVVSATNSTPETTASTVDWIF